MSEQQQQQALIETTLEPVKALLSEARPDAPGRPTNPSSTSKSTSASAMIDHTLLHAHATAPQIETLCIEAKQYGFASVCVNSVYVPLASKLLLSNESSLSHTTVKVCTVVGFPLGASLSQVKAFEARQAIDAGATEIDMVLHVGALKQGDWLAVYDDIRAVVVACQGDENGNDNGSQPQSPGVICKVIIETALLTDPEKVIACYLAKAAGADFVKTSTGFSTGGATVQDVALMRAVVGNDSGVGVKASGGVRSLQDAQAMIGAGATRIGASSGVKIAWAEHNGGGNDNSSNKNPAATPSSDGY